MKFHGPHDCSLNALTITSPELKPDKIRKAFLYCTKRWPNNSVSNKDFNICLRHLNVINDYNYVDWSNDKKQISDLPNRICVVLIRGHFVAVHNRVGINEHVSSSAKVYYYWSKRSGVKLNFFKLWINLFFNFFKSIFSR